VGADEDYGGDWECPRCGWDSSLDEMGENLLRTGPEHYAAYIAMEYGGNPVHWEEFWKCPECGTEWSYENANY